MSLMEQVFPHVRLSDLHACLDICQSIAFINQWYCMQILQLISCFTALLPTYRSTTQEMGMIILSGCDNYSYLHNIAALLLPRTDLQ